MTKISLGEIIKAIQYAREHKAEAGICKHPDEAKARMWSHHRPFVGKTESLWSVPIEWYNQPMTKTEMRRLAREVKERLTACLDESIFETQEKIT